jgi:hypothetical protein
MNGKPASVWPKENPESCGATRARSALNICNGIMTAHALQNCIGLAVKNAITLLHLHTRDAA